MSSQLQNHLPPVDNVSHGLDSLSEFSKCVHTCSLHTKVDPAHDEQKAALISLIGKTNNVLNMAQRLKPIAKNALATLEQPQDGGCGGLVYLGDHDAALYSKYRRMKGDYLIAKKKIQSN
jgi:hypothetical protein